MELSEHLKDIFKDGQIVTLEINTEYNFAIKLLKPSKGRAFTIIFTEGLSATKQNVSENFIEFEYIELYICLPDYWKIEDKSKENYWPIHWINKIAQIPQKNNSWFGPGDTIPAGNPPLELSINLKQNHFILAESMLFEHQLRNVIFGEKTVQFLAIIPIYQKEIGYKLRNSAKVFMAKYQYKNYTELVDNYREPVIGKVSFGKVFWYLIIALCLAIAFVIVYTTFGGGGAILGDRVK